MMGLVAISREKLAARINSIKYAAAADVVLKLDQLRRLRSELSDAGSVLVVEFLSAVIALLSDPSSPVRRLAIQMICDIGLKHSELLPEIIPALTDVLEDETPAVSRQAILSGIDIFRCSLIKVAIQGLHSSEMNESLKLSWEYALLLKDEIYSIAFEDGSEGKRLPALKFVESIVLLYTPDPNGSSTPPTEQISEVKCDDFNISWLRGGHPVLNVADLSAEASRSLGLLLDKLRFPSPRSNSYLMIIVLIKSLSLVARKRPAFYGRILPVLLGFDPSISASKPLHLAGVKYALKNAYKSCLDCTHHGAAPWQNRLLSALNGIKSRTTIEQPAKEIFKADGKSHSDDTDADKKPSATVSSEHSNTARKRTGIQEEFNEDEKAGKRVRSAINNSDETGNGIVGEQETAPPSRTISSRSDEDSGPVQQLVAMFGALVAQGEKAVTSLEILISSISADLLAEVVMANMRKLPPKSFKNEGSEAPLITMGTNTEMAPADTHIKRLSSLLSDILSQSGSSMKESEIEDHHHSVSTKLEQTREEEHSRMTSADSSATYGGLNFSSEQAIVSVSESISLEDVPLMETGYASIKAEPNDIEAVPNEIPGLALPVQDEDLPTFPIQDENLLCLPFQDADMPTLPFQDEVLPTLPIQDEDLSTLPIQDEDVPESSTSKVLADIHDGNSTDLDEGTQENMTQLGETPLEFGPLLSAGRPEELSLKGAVIDTASINSSTTASVGIVSRLVLPKISAPVIYLADEQKNQLQQLAFERIINAYKQVNIAGGSQVRVSVLAHSGMEFPTELDPWKLLKEHILSDYINHEGHELTLRVLYRLYGEAEGDRDFFSSSTATSVYETFLLQVAETLRDSFPASDKSLSRLLAEVPYLPNKMFEMLESLSSPRSNGNDDKELQGGDRVTQGLSTVWSLISQRPPYRDACLKIALKSAVHYLEEVRMKAIRLVANKLYPLPSMIEKIEEFAKEMLLSVVSGRQELRVEADEAHTDRPKEEHPSIEDQAGRLGHKEIYPDSRQYSASESISPSALAEVQRCMSLYFALCTKKHSLLRKVFDVYKDASAVAKQAIHLQIPLLVRTIGSSPDLLELISDPPTGSEVLLTQVIQTLTDGAVPSPDLVSTIKKLYDDNPTEVDILIPVLPFLPKDEVLALFRNLVCWPLDKFQVALSHIVQGSNQSAPVLTPAEALIGIHVIDPGKDRIPLKKITDACNACFEQRHIFTQQVLAKVLNQLVEQIPLPLLFMRTVLQAIGAFPSLVEFIMEILSRLVSKQIWNNPKLWVGFLKCALLTKPHSFGVLLQLPTAQLENALNKIPAIKDPLVAHASEPHIRSSLPRSTLVVLGIVSEPQTSTQIPPTETPNQEVSNSEKEAVTDNSKESSTGS